jgi:hypothetical protein
MAVGKQWLSCLLWTHLEGHRFRICPGRHFSNDALFLMATSLLATYVIAAPKDEKGNVAPMSLEGQNLAIR